MQIIETYPAHVLNAFKPKKNCSIKMKRLKVSGFSVTALNLFIKIFYTFKAKHTLLQFLGVFKESLKTNFIYSFQR